MSKRALLSVSDKTGLLELATVLVEHGWSLLSTGGTAKVLRQAGLPVIPIEEVTGTAEMMDGRVKTLHPKVHGAILGLRQEHAEQARAHGIEWIDLVVVNLYPFEAATAAGAGWDEAIENIDVGGPTMVRAAAKNHRHVAVVTDPADYPRIAEAVRADSFSDALLRELAIQAFRHTARYDATIAAHLARAAGDRSFPAELTFGARKVQDLRYGENPHQRAAFYVEPGGGRTLAGLVQHQGKELSFNNLADLDAAARVAFDLSAPACVIVKHNNPCGVAEGPNLVDAFRDALAADPVSAYGGIVAFNRPVDPEVVAAIKGSKVFFEVLVAPSFVGDSLARLSTRENLRVIELPAGFADGSPPSFDLRRVQGGFLAQDWDVDAPIGWTVVSRRAPTEAEARALRFAWVVARAVKSNAIVLAQATATGAATIGIGPGQTSRVDSVKIAVQKATAPLVGSVMASDAFFPFADGVEVAAAHGVSAVIHPGGSIRDAEVLAAADAADMALVVTGVRHFRH
jgi:phosphoribosylaminoimidazolecarboxamide formyltransferase / IMP cyclohydrolase